MTPMTVEEADKVATAFARFVAAAHPGLMRLFDKNIPESLLPYPKDRILRALDTCLEQAHKHNDIQTAKAADGLKAWLRAYTNDREALTLAVQRHHAL